MRKYRGVNSDWFTAFKGNYHQFISFNIHCNHHWSSHCMAESLKLILKISAICISACYLRVQCIIFKTNVKSGTIPNWVESKNFKARLRLIFEEILKFRRQQESSRTYCELSKRRVRSASYCYIAENQSGEACPHAFWRGRLANVCLQVIGACYGQLLLWLARPNNFQLKTSPPSHYPASSLPNVTGHYSFHS